jgi:FkbM family methyltransferase
MGFLRRVIKAADRPGGRWALALAFNTVAKLRGEPLAIRHDGDFWFYSSNGMTLPRGRKFDFYDFDLRTLAGRIRHYVNETENCWYYLYRPRPGDVIVDVGAEIGTDTISFSRSIGPTGKVIAIEAQPQTFELLLKACEANGLSNVSPLNVAVASEPGMVRITSDAGIESNFISDEGELVQADTLDNLLRDLPKIDLLKMNIEGAEQLAIKGMDETVEKTVHMAVACHDFVDSSSDWFCTIQKVSDYLSSKGFDIATRDSDDREYVRYHLHASRPGGR